MSQLKNIYPFFDGRFDIDRSGNGYLVIIRTSLNKKNETVKDVVRVKHLGYIDNVANDRLNHVPGLFLWERAITSGDYTRHMKRLRGEL